MRKRPKYDIHAVWDDPCDRPANRRRAKRCDTDLRIRLAVSLTTRRDPLVGPGLVDNISTSGLICLTKHRLLPGQELKVAIPTTESVQTNGFPEAFVGGATVVRTQHIDDRKVLTALQFEPHLSEDMEFAIFMEYLESIANLQTS